MSGTVQISRDIWTSPAFADEPMSEREAWMWMICEASWKPRKKRVGSVIVDTSRGEFAASVRFMAGAFGWTAPKVQRFLKRLERLEMISSKTDTGVTVVTICNYDKYQLGSEASDTGPIQDRYTSDTNEKKDEIREEREDKDPIGSLSSGDDASLPHLDDLSAAVSAYNASAESAGWPKVQKISPKRRSALKARLAEVGGLPGWEHALERARGSPHLCGQNDRGWTASFDFLTNASSFAKLMEGNYDKRGGTLGSAGGAFPGGNGRPASLASIVARRHAAAQKADDVPRQFPGL